MRQDARQYAAVGLTSIMLAALTGCGSDAPSAAPADESSVSPNASATPGDPAAAQALLDEGLQVARTFNTASFWSKVAHSFQGELYSQTLIGGWNLQQGRWEADVTENSTAHFKEFGRPVSSDVRYAAGTLYTSIYGWPDRLSGKWLAEKVVQLDGSDGKLPPVLDAVHQARATAVADKGPRVPGNAITATVPAPIALRVLALEKPLSRAGIDPRQLVGRATLEVDLDTDNRPRKIRIGGASLELDNEGAVPDWFTELASSATFNTDLTNYRTEVSVAVPREAALIDRKTELRDPRLLPEVAARREDSVGA